MAKGPDPSQVSAEVVRLLRMAVKAAKAGNGIGIVRQEYVVGELVGPWSDVKEVRA